MRDLVLSLVFLGVFGIASSEAQTLQLRQAGTGSSRVEAMVGEVIEVEIFVDLEEVSAAAVSLFFSVEGEAFAIMDNGSPEETGNQPFLAGPLFDLEPVVNSLLSETDDPVAEVFPGRQLDFLTFLSKPADSQAESGVLASFFLLALAPIDSGRIQVDANPVRDSHLRVVGKLTDLNFRVLEGMEITVLAPATSVTASSWGELKRSGP